MSDGPYDYAYERHLAERGVDLVIGEDGHARPVRRGPLPSDPRDDVPSRAELAEDERELRARRENERGRAG